MGDDETEKHLAVFMNIIYENDVDKALSDKVLVIKLPKEHVRLKLIINLLYLIKVSLKSGGYESIPYRLSSTFKYWLIVVNITDFI